MIKTPAFFGVFDLEATTLHQPLTLIFPGVFYLEATRWNILAYNKAGFWGKEGAG
jgi:hypothetical protein